MRLICHTENANAIKLMSELKCYIAPHNSFWSQFDFYYFIFDKGNFRVSWIYFKTQPGPAAKNSAAGLRLGTDPAPRKCS